MGSHLVFLGTYTKSGSRGIQSVRLDAQTGALGPPTLAAEAVNPAWITLSPDRRFLYAIHPSAAQAVGFSIDAGSGALAPLRADPELTGHPAIAPSHLAVDATGRVLLAANYHAGHIAAIPIRGDGCLGTPKLIPHSGRGPHPTRQDKPHPHSVTLSADNRFVIVCDLGLDKIFSYALDVPGAQLIPANPPFVETDAGAGPRHFKFGPDGRHAYAINELGNTITGYAYDAARGALRPLQTVSTLPAGFSAENITAEIRVHPNGRFLYGSNRGHDSLAVFKVDAGSGWLTNVEIIPSGGTTPRNFALSPDGNWLLCGHQDSENLTVFRVDSTTGRLTPTPNGANVSMCVCVEFYG